MLVIHVIPNEAGGGAERLVTELHSGVQRYGQECERVHFCGLPLAVPPVTRFGYRHDDPRNILQLRNLLKQRLQNGKQRVILHSHLTHGFYVSLIASRGLPVTWVHTEHNTSMRLREIRWLRPVERRCYERCDKVVAISQGVRHALQSKLGLSEKKIKILHNGALNYGPVDRSYIGDGIVKIVSVGSLNKRKGFETAIRALSMSSIGHWHYTIVGEGPELQTLKDLAIRLGVADRIAFAGWSDPAPYYRGADLQLMPSIWEGFGLVAVEGMSTGLRLLASDVDGLREVVGSDPEVGCLVRDHLDPSRWAVEIEDMVAGLRKSTTITSPKSVLRAQMFSIDKMINGYLELYQSFRLV